MLRALKQCMNSVEMNVVRARTARRFWDVKAGIIRSEVPVTSGRLGYPPVNLPRHGFEDRRWGGFDWHVQEAEFAIRRKLGSRSLPPPQNLALGFHLKECG